MQRTLARPITDILATMPGVARELRRVHVDSIQDVAVRWIGGKRSLAPLFASYGVPANSDFYPYLDLHAARYRFLHQSADELTGLLSYSVPLVAILEGRKSAIADPKGEGQDYLQALELSRRGLPIDPALQLTSPTTRAGGRQAIRALLERSDPPTAVLCYNDIVAFGAMSELGEHGLLVGQDFSITGFDGVAQDRHARPLRIFPNHGRDEQRVVGSGRVTDRREPELAGRAVDERAAEEQDP